MRLVPRSLFVRTACLIAVLLTISQLGTLVFFKKVGPSPHGPVEEALSGVVSMALFSLSVTPEADRPILQRRLDEIGKARFMDTPQPAPRLALPQSRLDQVLAEAIRRAFPPGAAPVVYLDRNHPSDRLWIRLPPGYGYRWLYLQRPPPPHFFPGPKHPASKAALLLTLVIGGSLIIARRINKPLRQLAEAAHELSIGRTPPAIVESGPDEVKTVISTFNQSVVTLKRMEEERNVMLAGISHDLRTPLTRLRLGVELLPEEVDARLRRRFIKDLGEINDIVDQFSHYVEGDSIDLQPDSDLNGLVRDAADNLYHRSVPIKLELSDLPPLSLDRTAIRRALTNLLENSIKYGANCIVVVSNHAAGSVRLTIRDDGPGIPEQDIPNLMRPFTRLDKSRNQVSGSGLGLAIVSRIAALHHGTLTLRNGDGGGLEATLTLPIADRVGEA